MANNQQLVKTVENLKSRYSFGSEGYKPNFIIVNNGSGGNEMSPTLKMFGSFLTEMRQFNADLLKAIEKLNDVVAVNTTYTKEIQEIEKKKDDKKNPKAVKEGEQNQFNPNGGNYHKVYATAIANQFKKDSALGKLYHKVTPDSIQMVLGGAFSAGKGLWNLNKSLRGALKVDKEAKAQKKAGKRYDEESGVWVAKDAPQGESKKEKGKLSKAIGGLTSFLKKGKKEKKGGGFLSSLLGGLGLLKIIGKFGMGLLSIITGFSLLKPLINMVINALPLLSKGIGAAASALLSFAGKAWDVIKSMAEGAWDKLTKGWKGGGKTAPTPDGKGKANKPATTKPAGTAPTADGKGNKPVATKPAGTAPAELNKPVATNPAPAEVGKATAKTAGKSGIWQGVKNGLKIGARGLGRLGGYLLGGPVGVGLLGAEGVNLLYQHGQENWGWDWSNKASDALLDFGVWLGDKGSAMLKMAPSQESRMKFRQNPQNYSDYQLKHAFSADFDDARQAFKEQHGRDFNKDEWNKHADFYLNQYGLEIKDRQFVRKSRAKADLNAANQNAIKEAAVEKRVEETGGANKQSPTVINNTPVTNVYNNNTTGGTGSMSARNTDASYIRNIDGNTAAFAY